MIHSLPNPPRWLRTVLAVSSTVAVVACVGLFYTAHRADEQWEVAIAHLDRRLVAIERRFPSSEWKALDEEVARLAASISLGLDEPARGNRIRTYYTKSVRTLDIGGFASAAALPDSPTPLDRAWWRRLVTSDREKNYPLDLGDGYESLGLEIRQERRWFTSGLQITLFSTTQLDDLRTTAFEEVAVELGLPLLFLSQPAK